MIFHIGDRVYKPKGYHYQGVVVARFVTLEKQIRYVVEMDESEGMLHIFSAEQLEKMQ